MHGTTISAAHKAPLFLGIITIEIDDDQKPPGDAPLKQGNNSDGGTENE